jgi:hypothetical protein
MLRRSIIAITIVAVLGLAACGDDDEEQRDAGATVTAAGDVERYCALTRRLDAEGEKFFADLGEDASAEQYEAAERRFIETHSGDLDELARVAPREITSDVQKLFAGMRERAGLKPQIEVSEAQASAAEERIRAFEKRSCRA